MANYNHHITELLDSNGNLKSEVIKSYSLGLLKPAHMHAVERYMLNSPFDADVVEGYQQMRKNKSAEYYVDQIQAKIPSIVGPEKVMQINYKLIAASFVGLIGLFAVGYLVSSLDFSSKNNELAVVKKEVQEVKKSDFKVSENTPLSTIDLPADTAVSVTEESIEEEIAIEEEQDQEIAQTATPSISPVADLEEIESKEVVAEEIIEENINDPELDALNDLVSQKMETTNQIEQDRTPEMVSFSKSNLASPDVSRKHASRAEKKGFTEASELRGEKSLLDEAGVRFKKKQYSDAAKFYDLVLSSSPSHQVALTYGGLSNLYSGNYSKAANQLSQVSNKNDMIKWNLATAYLKTGRKESAKALLKDLSEGSSYSNKAKEVLNTL